MRTVLLNILLLAITYPSQSQGFKELFESYDSVPSIMNQMHDMSDTEFLKSELNWKLNSLDMINSWIYQDAKEFIWFSSQKGLSRYDGNSSHHYVNNPNDTFSITNGRITHFKADLENDRIWMGYNTRGLHSLDLNSNKIQKFTFDAQDSTSLADDFVMTIFVGDSIGVWFTTFSQILHHFNEEKNNFERYFIPKPDKYKDEYRDPVPGDFIQDRNNKNLIWMGSRFGLFKFDVSTETFTHFDIDTFVRSYHFQFRTPIYQDENGLIWFGHFRNEGVKVFDPKVEKWIHKFPTGNIPSSLTYDLRPYGDSLIIASLRPYHLLVINRFDFTKHFLIKHENDKILSSTLLTDKKKSIYLGSNKVSRINTNFNLVDFPFNLKKDPSRLRAVKYDDIANLHFFGKSSSGGLYISDEYLERYVRIEFDKDHEDYNNNIDIRDVAYDAENQNIWLATTNGIYYYKIGKTKTLNKLLTNGCTDSERFTKIKKDHDYFYFINEDFIIRLNKNAIEICKRIDVPYQIRANVKFTDLATMSNDTLLIGTSKGIYLYNIKSKKLCEFDLETEIQEDPMEMYINAILTEKDTFWIGTMYSGLIKLVRASGDKFNLNKIYNKLIPEANMILSIAIRNKNIWTNGINGLQVYNRDKNDFLNYTKADGIKGGWRSKILEVAANNLLVDIVGHKMICFYPEQIKDVKLNPYINQVQVNDKIVRVNPYKNVEGILKLQPNQRNVNFELGAKNFGFHQDNFYRYRLIGLNNNWVDLLEQNHVNFVNLPPGKYTFEFDAKSINSFWNENPQKFGFFY